MPLDVGMTSWIKPLSDAIGDAFEPDELDTITLAATGDRLFKEFVGRGKPDRETAYDALNSFKERGFLPLFLAVVLQHRPRSDELRRLVELACPESLTVSADARAHIRSVTEGLEATLLGLSDPRIRAIIVAGRGTIRTMLDQTEQLAAYKSLHDCLHNLQYTSTAKLEFATTHMADDDIHVSTLIEFGQKLADTTVNARHLIDGFGATVAERTYAQVWVERLEGASAHLQAALDANRVAGVLAAIYDVRRIVRVEPPRLSTLISVTARSLPLAELISASTGISHLPVKPPPASDFGSAAMKLLQYSLLARVNEHRLCQDADNRIWDLEEALRQPPAEAVVLFGLTWAEAQYAARQLTALNPNASWATDIDRFAIQTADAQLTGELGPRLKVSFEKFMTRLRMRYFALDKLLLRDSEEIVKLGGPLRRLLGEIEHD